MRFEVIDDREEFMETLEGLRESVLAKDLGVKIKNAVGEVVFGNINTYVKHGEPPFIKFLMGIELKLSLTPSSRVARAFSPTNLLGVEGQRDRLPMGLLSPGKMEFLKHYEYFSTYE